MPSRIADATARMAADAAAAEAVDAMEARWAVDEKDEEAEVEVEVEEEELGGDATGPKAVVEEEASTSCIPPASVFTAVASLIVPDMVIML